MATVLGKLGLLTLWLRVQFAHGEWVTRSLAGEKGGGVGSLSSVPDAAVGMTAFLPCRLGLLISPGASPSLLLPFALPTPLPSSLQLALGLASVPAKDAS